MAVTNSTILDRIWLGATNDYQQRVPMTTQGDIAATQAALFAPENLNLYNQFVDALINRIGSTYVHQQQWRNPLRIFKKDMLRYGDKAQEIAVKWIRSHSYADNREDVFKMYRPDANVWFHTVNRREFYPITVNREELEFAFTEEYGLNSFVAAIMQAPQNSDEYDEYRIMLQLLAHYENNFGFYKHQLSAAPSSEATAKELLVELRAYAGDLRFPSSRYNAGLIRDVPVFANPDELVVLMTPRTNAVVDVMALAAAFNMDRETIQQRIVMVDEFPVPDAVALLTTTDFFQCRDKLNQTTSQYNPLTLGTNYFLHRWGSYSVSPFVPAILFTTGSGTSINTVTQALTAITLTADTTPTNDPGTTNQLSVALTGTLTEGNSAYAGDAIKLAPDAATYELGIVRGTDAVRSVRTWVDEYAVLHIGEDLQAGDTITVTATSTYVNPSGATSPMTSSINVVVGTAWTAPTQASEADPESTE